MKTDSISDGLAVQARTITTTGHLGFRRAWLWTRFLAFAVITFGPRPAQAAMTEAWVQRYGSEAGSQDSAYQIVTDATGNVIVAGTSTYTQPGSGSDMQIIKYSGAGVPLWTNRYNGAANAVAVDGSGNVFVAGSSYVTGGDYVTVAYSGAGVPLWTNRYNGPDNLDDRAIAIAVDGSGKVFVTGYSYGSGSSSDYATIAYSGAGVPLWTNRYNGPANGYDVASALAVDGSGNVFVTGRSAGSGGGDFPLDYATIAYSGAGVPLWTNRYNGPANSDDAATAVAVDGSGNVFVTGSSGYWNGFDWISDYATIAYSGAGVPLWTRRYNGPGNGPDQAVALAVDASGNVFVTGNYYPYGSGGAADSATIAYSGAGVPLWTKLQNGSASALAVDGRGNVFVTGYSQGGVPSLYDYATIAYSGAGVPLWTNRYNGPANGLDYANAVAVDGNGNVFVAGYSYGSGGDTDYATIAYSGAGVPLWTNRCGGRGEAPDIANAVAVDASGNVFVTGSSATIAYSGAGVPLWTNGGAGTAIALDGSGNVYVTGSATIAYTGAGVPLWTNRYDGDASAMVVDASGNVFVTGSSYGSGGDTDYATIAYTGAGLPLWTNRYNGPGNGSDIAIAMAVDASGNVFVTGSSAQNCFCGDGGATIAYSGAGVPLWTNRYNGPGRALAVDASGNVFVTGRSVGSGEMGPENYATVAYSGAGVPLWTNRYDGDASAMAVDASGNVFVTGSSYGSGGDTDYATIAYSGAGVPLWTNRYNGPGNWEDQPTAIAVDGSGNVFVTGNSTGSGGSYDYGTIAYSGAGVPLWTNRYNGPVYIPGGAYSKLSLAIGSDGAVYVTGASDGDFATAKYVWQTEIAIQLMSTIPPKVNLTLSGAPNSSWAIERARELTGPWTNLSALLIGPNGAAHFQDTNSPSPSGFYRARQ